MDQGGKPKAGDECLVDEMAQILFTNLLLLGMDMSDMEAHTKISFNKDMFNLPNKGGAEAVLHFLFFRLNPSLSDERFRDCWPIIDKKREMQFRKTCNNWIVTIQKNAEDAHLPKLNPALLLSPGGRKFIHFLYSLSTYILTQVMKREHDWKPNSAIVYPSLKLRNKNHASVMSSSIKDSTLAEMKIYFNHLHLISGANHSWKAYSDELVKDYRGLTKRIRDVEQEKRQLVNLIADTAVKLGCSLPAKRTLTMFDSDMGQSGMKRSQRIEQARSRWTILNNFFELFSKKREIIQSIVDRSSTHRRLEGAGIGVCVPGLLLREFKKDIQQQQIDSVYIGGRLNLVPVLQMWNLCLRRYLEQITAEDLPDVSKEVRDLNSQAHKHHSFLKDVHSLRDEMTNVIIPELEKAIQDLRDKLKNSQDSSITQSSLGLELTKPASPVNVLPGKETASDSPFNTLLSQPRKKDTPDAVAAVIQSVTTKSQGSKAILPSRLAHAFTGINQNERTPQSVPRKEDAIKRKLSSRGATTRSTSNLVTNNASLKARAMQPEISHKQPVNQSSVESKREASNLSRQKLLDKMANSGKKRNTISSPVMRKMAPSQGVCGNSKALDLLANSIVDSVLLDEDAPQSYNGPRDVMRSGKATFSPLSAMLASELELSAFASHDRLGRSPQGSDGQRNKSLRFIASPMASDKSSRSSALDSPEHQQHHQDSHSSPFVSKTNGEASGSVRNSMRKVEWRSPKAPSPVTWVQKELASTPQSESSSSGDETVSTLLATGKDNVEDPFDSFLSTVRSKSMDDSYTSSAASQVAGGRKAASEMHSHLLSHSASPSFALVGNSEDCMNMVSRQRTSKVAVANVDNLLGDRPCGDGEASEESSPTSKVIYINSDSTVRKSRLFSLETKDSDYCERDVDLVLHTSRMISSFTTCSEPLNADSSRSDVHGDEIAQQSSTDASRVKVSREVGHSFLDISGDMEGLDDLVESDVDDGLNESFAPLKRGMHIDNSPMKRFVDLEVVTPPGKAKTQISARSPEFRQDFLSSPSLGSPFQMKPAKTNPPTHVNVSEKLAQLHATAALILDD